MKKTIIAVFLFVLVAAPALATPFLVCDPYLAAVVQPSYFELMFDGGSPVQSPVETVPTGVRLHYDLASMTVGSHAVIVKACNQWGCSSTVPFSFSKGVPSSPAGIKLE